MLLTHTICAVESYKVTPDRPGAFGDEIIVEGWFLTHSNIHAMKLVFKDGTEIEVVDRQRDSAGLVGLYGNVFGERAAKSRFLLIEPVGMRNIDYASAVFLVEFDNNEIYRVGVGHLLSTPARKEFSDADAELIMSFESCGDNCEFGLVQRRVGRERLSFLRYAGVGDVFALSRGIADGLRVFDNDDAVTIIQHGHEWMASVPSLGLAFHTGRNVHAISFEKIRQAESQKMAFMAQKFIDDCALGEKIFVYRVLRDERGGPDGTRGMNEMYEALRQHGPARLLWVNTAAEGAEANSIVQVREGLYRGFIDHLAPHSNAFDFRPHSWLRLLALARETMTAG